MLRSRHHPVHPDYQNIGGRPRISGKCVPGLTTGWLKKAFYPNADIKNLPYAPPFTIPPPVCTTQLFQPTVPKRPTKTHPLKLGQKRGKQLDKMLTESLDLMRKYGSTVNENLFGIATKKKYTMKECLLKTNNNATDATILRRLLNSSIKAFCSVHRYYDAHGLYLIETQLPCGVIFNPKLKRVTAIDNVCYRPTVDGGELIIVEIKHGRGAYIYRHSGMMHEPFQNYTNCTLHKYYLQVLFTRLFYQTTFPIGRLYPTNRPGVTMTLPKLGPSILLLADRCGVNPFRVPNDFAACLPLAITKVAGDKHKTPKPG